MTAIGPVNFIHSLFRTKAAFSWYVVKYYWLVTFSYLTFVGCFTARCDLTDYKLLVIAHFWHWNGIGMALE